MKNLLSGSKADIEARARRKAIHALRMELRQGVFSSGLGRNAIKFFNKAIIEAAKIGRKAENPDSPEAGYRAEAAYLREAIDATRSKQFVAGAGHNTQVPSYKPAPGARVTTAPAASSGPGVPLALAPAVAASTPRAAVAPPISPVALPAATAAVAPSPNPMSATAASDTTKGDGKPNLAQLLEISRVFGCEFPNGVNREDRAAMLAAVERCAYQNHLTVPGMASEEILAAKFHRIEAGRIKGMLRIERATRQASINRILAAG